MPVVYRVDSALRTVFSTAYGVLTGEDLLTHRRRLDSDPAAELDSRQLWDFRGVSEIVVSKAELLTLVDLCSPFGSGARRAFVAGLEVDFGMLRMFHLLREEGLGEIRVFRDIKEARSWLALPDEGS